MLRSISILGSIIVALFRPPAALTVFNLYGWLVVPWVWRICGYSSPILLIVACLAATASTAWLYLFLPTLKLRLWRKQLLGLSGVLLLGASFYGLSMLPTILALPLLTLITILTLLDLGRRENWHNYHTPRQIW
jgi:hypothetical protein